MTGAELLSALRISILDDVEEPYLWADSELYRALDLALLELLTEVPYLNQPLPATENIAITAPTALYNTPAGVTKIFRGYLVTSKTQLPVVDAATGFAGTDQTPFNPSDTATPYLIDWAIAGQIQLVPAPAANDTLRLEVLRLPSATIVSDPDATLPFPVQHHESLLHGSAYRLFLKQDAETYDLPQSKHHQGLWERSKEAFKRDMIRRRAAQRINKPLPGAL